MLDKIKGLGAQVATKAGDAVESLANTATGVTEALNEKAVRASTAQACRILEIALEELKGRPLAARPVQLTATVNVGIAALELQVQVPPAASERDGAAVVPAHGG